MAKSNSKQPTKNTQAAIPLKPQPVSKARVEKTPLSGDLKFDLFAIGAIVAVIFIFFNPSLQNNFTNWDDPGYVVNNPVIKDLSGAGLYNIFATPIMGNYHPITILTYAIEYSLVELAPKLYHIDSLLFHIATTCLVYWFVRLLVKRKYAALITALLFGLHPMHVESVAWIAGRKDVVYGMFYMAACVAYVYYKRMDRAKGLKLYLSVLLLFLLSLLSKPVAVILPVTLLAIDFFEGKLFNTRTVEKLPETDGASSSGWSLNLPNLLEKIPFFAISAGFGWKSLYDQRVFGALATQGESYNFIERFALGGYALVTYLWKAVVPVKLVCFYPYPLKVQGSLPAIYYVFPVIAFGILGFLVWYFRRNKTVIFGILFFLINIALLLQFIPVGGAIIADRYSYIPYLGLFLLLGWLVSEWYEEGKNKSLGKGLLFGVLAYCGILGYMSSEQCKVWNDGMTLWRHEIEVEPVRAPNGYNNLGFFYFSKFNNSVNQQERKIFYDSSRFLLSKAIELQPKFTNPYISMGELLRSNSEFQEAKKFYYKALALDSTEMSANAYLGLAIVYCITNNFDSAYFCFTGTFKKQKYNPEAHSNFGNFLDMTGRADSAIAEYGIAIEQNPDLVHPYLNRGRAYQRKGLCEKAFPDFNKAIQLMPEMGEIYYARSKCFMIKGDKAAAVNDVKKARSLGFTNMEPAYLQSLQ